MVAKQISFTYNTDCNFICDLCAEIKTSEITTILGPNGSGKSTLLNLFIRELSPTAGQIYIEGTSIKGIKQKEFAKKVATVHQYNSAPGDVTVKDLVAYGRSPHQSLWRMNSTEDDEEIIEWALAITGLVGMKDKCVSQLSGGERQRAWIALSLAQKTDVLFLDEPTTYLDIAYQFEVLNLIQELNRKHGITIVMVLHDINQAIQYSDNLIVLKDGKIVFDGSAEDAITQEMLKEVYGIDVVIRHCPVNHCKYIIPIQLTRERVAL